MMRPSDSWPEMNWNDFIKTRPEFSHIKLNRIPIAASALRSGVACTLSRRFVHGSAHAVFEIVFDDGCIWMCRVRHRDPDESPQYLRMTMDSTVAAIRYVQQYTNVPAPTVYHYQSDPSINDIGSSHMFMEAIPGRKRDLPKEKIDPIGLQTMYNQIADSAVQMARLNFPKIGRIYQLSDGQYDVGPFINPDGSTYGPFSTSGEYYAYMAEKTPKHLPRCIKRSRRKSGTNSRPTYIVLLPPNFYLATVVLLVSVMETMGCTISCSTKSSR